MSVYDFCYYALDDSQDVAIWSLDGERIVFEGTYDEARYLEYADEEVQSFDISNNMLTLNI